MAPQNRVTRLLLKNILLALLSVLLGTISWWYLTSKVEGTRTIPLTLEFRIPPGNNFAPQPAIKLIQDGQAEPIDKIECEINVTGLKDQVSQLEPSALKLQFTVEQEDYPHFQIDPGSMLLGLDAGLTAQVVHPKTYSISFAKQFETQATVKLDYNHTFFEPGGGGSEDWAPPSYLISPSRITVTGRLDKLQVQPDQQVFLYTKHLDLKPDDVKSGVWKSSGTIELSDKVEIVDAQNKHVDWVTVNPEIKEVGYEATVETRPETGSVQIPVQVLPPVDQQDAGSADAFDTYLLASGSPRQVTVQYSKPRKSDATMDSSQVFAFVNVTSPGNLTNLPIAVYTTQTDQHIKVWLAAGADGTTPHANVKMIRPDVGASVSAVGPFPIRPIFTQQADRRYQVVITPLALTNLVAHGSNRTLGDKPLGADDITLLVDIHQAAFSGREYDKDLPLLVVKPDRVVSLTTADGKPLPMVHVKLIPPPLVPDTRPQLIGDVAVEVEYPPNFQLRVRLIDAKVAVSASGAKDTIDALRPEMLVAVARPISDDDRPDFTGKARIVGVYRKVVTDGQIVGLEAIPDVQLIPAGPVEFKTEKAAPAEHTGELPGPLPPPQTPPGTPSKFPVPPPYGS
ncbi:MAG: hypothetical protein ACREJ2_13655 [Planctomycetota bacterium]